MTHNGDHEEGSEKLHTVPPAADDETAAVDFAAELEKSRTAIDGLQKELDQSKKDFLYLRAEFDNYKRHAIKERSDLLKYGGERVIVEILEVMDNFERALQTEISESNFQSFRKGVDMISHELKAKLLKFGLLEVESHGKPFDPMIHEALSSEEHASLPPGHITRVFRKPYKLHDKVVRTGQVVVAKEATGESKS